MGELQDMFKKFMGQQMQTNQNLQNAVNKLEVQVGQIASSLSNRASGTFPSQTEVNPRHYEQVKAVHILRSGKQVDNKHEQVALSEEVSAVLQRKLPPKLKDPGSFSIPCMVGDLKIPKALLDLGASINLMPYHVYEKLNLGELQATTVSIQLADRTIRYPKGILEDVLVNVEGLILPS
ncbi:unnamed protein product [Prunus brigantina]